MDGSVPTSCMCTKFVLFCNDFLQISDNIGEPSKAFICTFVHFKSSYSSVYNLYIFLEYIILAHMEVVPSTTLLWNISKILHLFFPEFNDTMHSGSVTASQKSKGFKLNNNNNRLHK